jgi:putative membrane protein
MVRAADTVGFLFLVTACFAAIAQWLNARFAQRAASSCRRP